MADETEADRRDQELARTSRARPRIVRGANIWTGAAPSLRLPHQR